MPADQPCEPGSRRAMWRSQWRAGDQGEQRRLELMREVDAAEAARTNTRGFGAATPTAHTGEASGEVQTRARAATTTARETTTLVRESAVAFPNIE